MSTKWKLLAAVSLLLALPAVASAWINVKFPPPELARQSDVILVLEFKNVGEKGDAVAGVQKVLKGKFDQKEIKFDLLAMPKECAEQGKLVMDEIGRGNKQVMMFIGAFTEGREGGEDMGAAPPAEGGEAKGFVHMGALREQWINLSCYDNTWEMEKLNAYMLGTFAGSTDMLLRCVNYVLADPDADVPVDEGVNWDKEIQVGKLTGKCLAACPVDVTGGGKADLFLAGEAGDRLFRWNGKGFDDVTAKHALAAKSLAFAWGDFNGDGRIDLASWDGKQLSIHSQKDDGAFAAKACDVGDALKNGCLSLATLDSGNKGRPALLAATKASPVLLVLDADGKVQARELVSGEFPGKDFGDAGRCFVADFDDDGAVDVLQLCAQGGLFYKGKAPAEFAAPVKTEIGTGAGRHAACLGDFDGDGLPDVFVAGDARNLLWQNLGAGKFAETLDMSGEVAYISKGGGIGADTGDFNNDGRQDIFIAYGTQMSPQLFFNRGFRCFGHARMVDLNEQKLLPKASEGQQTGCLGDFNGDGALDMVLVLADGEVWLFPRKVDDGRALAAQVTFSLASPSAGPINVIGLTDKRSFGAWQVRAGDAPAVIGVREAAPITIKWRLPDGKVEQREVVIKSGPVRVVLDKK